MNKFKVSLLSFGDINITVLCLFDIIIKNSIIKFFMIYILLSFLNFLQKNTDIYQSFFFDKQVYSKIYESFMLLPLIRYFFLLSENIFNKHTIFLDNYLHYRNFYLINLDENNTNIFSFNNLHNDIDIKKRYKNKILWNELLFHARNLKQYYYYKLGRISDKEYQKYFIKIEYNSTCPYLIFIIRFLPLLNGIALIHEYDSRKRKKNALKINEFEIVYWNDLYLDIENERCIKEPKIIKERESFIYAFLSGAIPYANFFYESKLNTYYSEEILNIINKIIEKGDFESSLNINYLLSQILQFLYLEYLKNVIQDLDNHKIIEENKFKSQDDMIKRKYKLIDIINEDKNEIVNNDQWNYSNFYHNQNLFKITKTHYLLTLFKPTDNISRFKKNTINVDDYDNDKYEYINIDLKKGFHKSINLSMKFPECNCDKKSFINKNNESLNNILLKPISNYTGSTPTTFEQSTNNITSDNKSLIEENTFCSLKLSGFNDLNSLFCIENKNNSQ